MNARYPDADTAQTEEGTAAHWVAFGPNMDVIEGMLAPNGVAVTEEMIEGCELVHAVLIERVPMAKAPHFEEQVRIPSIHKDCFGTPDVWAYDPERKHLEIIDYKFGHRFVDEFWNPQGLLYMLGIIDSKLPEVPETVSFTIVQPRCYYRGAAVRTHTFKTTECRPHINRLRDAAVASTMPAPDAQTGPQCETCPGRHACPTLQKAAYADAETATSQQPVDLTPAAAALELRMLDRALSRLTARVEGLRELTLVNLRAGKRVPHYKVESGRGRLSWKVSPEEVISLGKLMGKELTVPKLITPTQAAKLSLDEAIISRYADIIPGGLKLVESNDKDAARVFKLQETK